MERADFQGHFEYKAVIPPQQPQPGASAGAECPGSQPGDGRWIGALKTPVYGLGQELFVD